MFFGLIVFINFVVLVLVVSVHLVVLCLFWLLLILAFCDGQLIAFNFHFSSSHFVILRCSVRVVCLFV